MFILGLNKCWTGPRFSALTMAATVIPTTYDDDSSDLSRSSFPKGFVFGTASAAYQVCFLTLCVLLCIMTASHFYYITKCVSHKIQKNIFNA